MSAESENKLPDKDAITNVNESLDKSINDIFRLMNHYEGLVSGIQREARNFQEENHQLREQLAAIIEENNRLRNHEKSDLAGEFKNNYIEVADKIFSNLRNQLLLSYKEKDMYENLWKKTASVLEKEVPLHSLTKLKVEHSLEMKALREELIACQSEHQKQTKVINALQTNIKKLMEKLEAFQLRNKELSAANSELADKLKEANAQKAEIERMLEESNDLNKEQMHKSTESFKKMQEAIRVAENAMAEIKELMEEKQQLEYEKRQIEDEHSNLAQTIGSVIEQAAEKVDKDIDELKRKHKHEMEKCRIEIEQWKQMAELEKAKTASAMQQTKALEEKLHSIDTTNSFLGQDLQLAIKTLVETEEKIATMKEVIENEKQSNKLTQHEVKKLRSIIENNNKVKQKWKELIYEITKKLEGKITELIAENEELKKSRRIM